MKFWVRPTDKQFSPAKRWWRVKWREGAETVVISLVLSLCQHCGWSPHQWDVLWSLVDLRECAILKVSWVSFAIPLAWRLIPSITTATRSGLWPSLWVGNLTAPHCGLCHALVASHLRVFLMSSCRTLGFSLGTHLALISKQPRNPGELIHPGDHPKPVGKGPYSRFCGTTPWDAGSNG